MKKNLSNNQWTIETHLQNVNAGKQKQLNCFIKKHRHIISLFRNMVTKKKTALRLAMAAKQAQSRQQ